MGFNKGVLPGSVQAETVVLNAKKLVTVGSDVAVAPSSPSTCPAQMNAAREERLEWWRDAKLGFFIHWGPASVAGVEISWARMDHPFDHPGHQNMSTDEYDQYTRSVRNRRWQFVAECRATSHG